MDAIEILKLLAHYGLSEKTRNAQYGVAQTAGYPGLKAHTQSVVDFWKDNEQMIVNLEEIPGVPKKVFEYEKGVGSGSISWCSSYLKAALYLAGVTDEPIKAHAWHAREPLITKAGFKDIAPEDIRGYSKEQLEAYLKEVPVGAIITMVYPRVRAHRN